MTYSCFLDGVVVPDCTSPRTLSGLAEGEHVLEVMATNAYGFAEAQPATFNWIVAIAPVAEITSGPPATTLLTTASIAFSGTDNETPAESLTFECSLDGAEFAQCTSPLELTGLAIGDHTVRVRAVDALGNVGEPDSRSWTVEAPPPPNTPVGSNVTVELDLPGGQSATVTFAGIGTAGNTTVDTVPGGPPLPVGYLTDGALYYDVSTNASYSAPVTVCFTYVPGSLDEPVRLLHWDAGANAWVDVTTSSAAGEVCGATDSLSPFAIATASTLVVPETTIESGPPATTASSTATFFFSTGEPNDPTATYACSVRRRHVVQLLRVAIRDQRSRAGRLRAPRRGDEHGRDRRRHARQPSLDGRRAEHDDRLRARGIDPQHGGRVPLLVHRLRGDVRVLARRRDVGLL